MAIGVALLVLLVPLSLAAGNDRFRFVPEADRPGGDLQFTSQSVHVQDGSPVALTGGYEYTLLGARDYADSSRIDHTRCRVEGPGVADYRLLDYGYQEGHAFFQVTANGSYTMTCGSGTTLHLSGKPTGWQAFEEAHHRNDLVTGVVGVIGLLAGPLLIFVGLVLLLVQGIRRSSAIGRLEAQGHRVPPRPARSSLPGTLTLATLAAAIGIWLSGVRSQRLYGDPELYLLINGVLWVIGPLLAVAAATAWVVDGRRRDRAQTPELTAPPADGHHRVPWTDEKTRRPDGP